MPEGKLALMGDSTIAEHLSGSAQGWSAKLTARIRGNRVTVQNYGRENASQRSYYWSDS